MMKRKLISVLLAATMVLALPAYGYGSSDESESESEGQYYANVIYYAGDDIPAGNYVINCTGTDSVLEVTVFASEESYEDFQRAEKFTNGEYRNAVEQCAWADSLLYEGEEFYVGLREGYIILLDDGKCEFTKYDPADGQTIYPGIYVVGEDLNAEKVGIKCTSEYMKVTQFASKDDYLEYHKMSRFTHGEESDAIEAHAASSDFIYEDESTYVNLKDGMVIMVEDGAGECSVAEGPIIH